MKRELVINNRTLYLNWSCLHIQFYFYRLTGTYRLGAVLEGDQWQKLQFEEEDDDVRNEVYMEMYSLYYVSRGYFSFFQVH